MKKLNKEIRVSNVFQNVAFRNLPQDIKKKPEEEKDTKDKKKKKGKQPKMPKPEEEEATDSEEEFGEQKEVEQDFFIEQEIFFR